MVRNFICLKPGWIWGRLLEGNLKIMRVDFKTVARILYTKRTINLWRTQGNGKEDISTNYQNYIFFFLRSLTALLWQKPTPNRNWCNKSVNEINWTDLIQDLN